MYKRNMELNKKQYAHLIRDIEKSIKDSFEITGGGLYDFSAPETLERHPLSKVEFWVADDDFEGGGFFSSIGNAFKHVYGALRKSGVIDKAKNAALKAGGDLGNKAINAAAQKVDAVAKSKGFDTSRITSAAVGKAQNALTQAQGHAADLMDQADSKLGGNGMYMEGGHFYNVKGRSTTKGKHRHVHNENPKRVRAMPPGLQSGSGMYQSQGRGMVMTGQGMYQAGHFQGAGLIQTGSGYVSAPVHNVGMPPNARIVAPLEHLNSYNQVAAGGY